MPGQVNSKDGEQFRKLFIGGLSYDTTEDSLKEFYQQWGDVVDCVVMRDPQTKKSRGFGFITYDDAQSVDDAQDKRPHVIDGKEVEAKRATPREESYKPNSHVSVKKAYISGIKEEHTEEQFKEFYGQYGNVEKVEIILHKETGKKRGFAFVTFDDYDPVDKLCLEKNHMINGHRCDIKKAVSRDQQQQGGGRGGGRGGGFGGNFGGSGMGMGRGIRGGRGGGYSGGYNDFSGGYDDSYDSYGGGGGFGGGSYGSSYGGGSYSSYGSGGGGGGAMRGSYNTQRNSGGYGNKGRGGGGYSQNRY